MRRVPPGETRGGDEILLAFSRALRAGGVAVTQDRAHEFLCAVAELGTGDPQAVRVAGRATLCASPEDLTRFDQIFEAFFNARDGLPRPRPAAPAEPRFTDFPEEEPAGEGELSDEVIRAAASATEVLRQRDVASLTSAEKQRLDAMFATLRPRAPMRRTARHERWHRGQVDASRTLRSSLRRLGEPATIEWE